MFEKGAHIRASLEGADGPTSSADVYHQLRQQDVAQSWPTG